MLSWSKISRANKSRPSLDSLLTSQCPRRQIYLTQYMLLTHAHDLLFLQLRAVGSQFTFSVFSFLFGFFLKINTGCICLRVNLIIFRCTTCVARNVHHSCCSHVYSIYVQVSVAHSPWTAISRSFGHTDGTDNIMTR